jgi:hypothetical protein
MGYFYRPGHPDATLFAAFFVKTGTEMEFFNQRRATPWKPGALVSTTTPDNARASRNAAFMRQKR